MLTYICNHAPKVVILENVLGLLKKTSDSTGNVHPAHIEVVLAELRAAGYNAEHYKLNSSNFLMPQRRWRVYIVAFADGFGRSCCHDLVGAALGRLQEISKSHRFALEQFMDLRKPTQSLLKRESRAPTRAMTTGKLPEGGDWVVDVAKSEDRADFARNVSTCLRTNSKPWVRAYAS